MIAGEVANQPAEAADVIEQFLVDSTFRATVGLLKSVFSSRRVTGAETSECEQTQQWRFCAPRPCRLLEVLHCFLVAAPLEGDRSKDLERIVAQLSRGVFQRFAGQVAGSRQVFAELGFDHRELVNCHPAGQFVDSLLTAQSCRDPMGCSKPSRVAKRLQKGHDCCCQIR